MKHTVTLYLLSEDTDFGYNITAYHTEQAREARQLELMKEFSDQNIDDLIRSGETYEAWEAWRLIASEERHDYFGTSEQALSIDLPEHIVIPRELIATLRDHRDRSMPYSTTFLDGIPQANKPAVETQLKAKFLLWWDSWIAPLLDQLEKETADKRP